MHAGHLLAELDGPTLKGIFDAAFIDALVDSDWDFVVRDDLTLVASADPGKELFKVYASFPTSGTREQALEFHNKFNLPLVVVRAVAEHAGFGWPVIFDYGRRVFEDRRIEAGTIVKTLRRVEAIVRNGISRYDEGKLFRRLIIAPETRQCPDEGIRSPPECTRRGKGAARGGL